MTLKFDLHCHLHTTINQCAKYEYSQLFIKMILHYRINNLEKTDSSEK